MKSVTRSLFKAVAVSALAFSFIVGGYAAEDRPEPVKPPVVAEVEPAAPEKNEIPDRILRSTYRIACYTQDLYNKDGVLIIPGRPSGFGTGNAISARHILTAAHVANGFNGEQYKADVFDDKGVYTRSIPLSLVRVGSALVDVALLEAAEDLPHYNDNLKLADARVKQLVFNVGAKLGLEPFFITPGVVAAKGTLETWGWNDSVYGGHEILYAMSMQIAPGCSGGGVYDLQGRMVGIVTRGSSEYGITFMVPAVVIKSFLSPLDE